ncbi:hypothetical protein BRC2024_YMPIZCAT_CDS_0044 [Acinetobacter phage vB_AbaP_Margaret]
MFYLSIYSFYTYYSTTSYHSSYHYSYIYTYIHILITFLSICSYQYLYSTDIYILILIFIRSLL